jgi:hypothetical protein
MSHGLKHLRNILFLLFLIFSFSFGCTPQTQQPVDLQDTTSMRFQTHSKSSLIGKLQSELVTLTIQCEKGNQKSCDKVPVKKAKLEKLLQSNK